MRIQIPTSDTDTITPSVRAVAYISSTWDDEDEWTLAPYLQPLSASRSVAPTISTASLRFRFGDILYGSQADFQICDPMELMDHYVRIHLMPMRAAGRNRPVTAEPHQAIWTGIITEESITPHGADAGSPQGDQSVTAWGMEHLLDIRPIETARSVIGGELYEIQTAPDINARDTLWGAGAAEGNRSTSLGPDGVYTFQRTGGQRWTARQYLDYLLEYHQPPAETGIRFEIDGQVDVLDHIYPDTYAVDGRTPWQVLEHILPRQRGVVWWVEVRDDTPVIMVDTVFGEPVSVGDVTIPANSRITDFDWSNKHDIQRPVVRETHTALYDRVIVRGDPIVSCFSARTSVWSLMRMWDDDDETAYAEATREERTGEQHEHTYRRYRIIPGFWLDIPESNPAADPAGGVDAYTQPMQYSPGRGALLRWLPFPELVDSSDTSTTPERRLPFAWATYDPDPDDPSVSARIVRLDAGYPSTDDEHHLDGIGLRIRDTDMSLDILASPPHILALNHLDPDALAEDEERELEELPRIDYTTIGVTVAVELDQRLRVEADLSGRDPEHPRILTIDVPDAAYWHVAPGTIAQVRDGELIEWDPTYRGWQFWEMYEVDPLPLRDDSDRLRQIAALAKMWYGYPRRSMSFSRRYLTPTAPIGVYVNAAFSGEWQVGRVGTVVTQTQWDFETGITSYETAYREIDLQRMVEFPGMSDARSLARTVRDQGAHIRDLHDRTANLPTRTVPGRGRGGAGELSFDIEEIAQNEWEVVITIGKEKAALPAYLPEEWRE